VSLGAFEFRHVVPPAPQWASRIRTTTLEL
jgi:hypothetical protein